MVAQHVTGAQRQGSRNAERGADAAQRATLLGVLALLALLSVGRLLITTFSYAIPAWFDEELNPLIGFVTRGEPITQIDARQYGVVVFLVFDPALRLFGPNLTVIATYATWVSLVTAIIAFAFVARRYAVEAMVVGATDASAAQSPPGTSSSGPRVGATDAARVQLPGGTSSSDPCVLSRGFGFEAASFVVGSPLRRSAGGATWRAGGGSKLSAVRVLILLVVWSSAVPLLYVLAQHMVDAWQLCFLAASLYLFTGSPRQRRLAALPLAAATLTKLLPALLLVYLFVRSWRVGLIGVAGVAVLLAIGQVFYGTLMGFGYPLMMALGGGDTVARWSTHFENNSLRGLLFKLGAGFRLQGDTTAYILDSRLVPFLSGLAYALALALVGYLLVVAWRSRGQDSVVRRSIEFSLGIVTMLLISPHTAQDYLVTMLPVLGVWLFLWTNRLPRAWSVGQTALGALATLLIAVIVPMNLFIRVLPINWLLNITQNSHNILFADQIGSGIGVYEFFGLPGLGLLLGWVLLVRLERQSNAR